MVDYKKNCEQRDLRKAQIKKQIQAASIALIFTLALSVAHGLYAHV